jgi:hypothetical protein
MKTVKKVIYVTLFAFLGLLIATIVHAVIEAPVLWLITGNLDKWGEGFIWQNWAVLHRYVGGLVWILGLIGGIYGGIKYWRIIYIEKRFGRSKF